jgi:hypothetical protein
VDDGLRFGRVPALVAVPTPAATTEATPTTASA